MALIIEDGTGKPNANSFCSVAFADEYHALRGNVAWTSIVEVATKEQLLVKATDYAEGIYALAWPGRVAGKLQALSWPRIGATARGFPIDSISIPNALAEATAELALIAKTTPLIPNVTRGKKRVKVGTLEVEYDGNGPMATRFVAASLKLSVLLASTQAGGPMVKLTRC